MLTLSPGQLINITKLALHRITAISLVLILFFNLAGYRLLLQYWENQATEHLEARIDNQDYAENELIEMKIPLTVPYSNSSKNFERYSGEIDIEGVHYKYVMRKVYNDSLVLLCIPNTAKTQMVSARDEFFRMINELQKDNSGKKAADSNTAFQIKFSFSDYTLQQNIDWNTSIFSEENKFYNTEVPVLLSSAASSPGQPPDSFA